MQIINREYKVFDFEELSKEAKEEATNIVTNDIRENDRLPDFFTSDIREDIKEFYGLDIDTKNINYSLGYCQGDGASFIGNFDIMELINNEKTKKYFTYTSKQRKYIKLLYDWGIFDNIELERTTTHYYHEFTVRANISIDYSIIRNEATQKRVEALATTIENDFTRLKSDICGHIEKNGYSYFYDVDEDDIKGYIEANETKFFENGKIFNL